MVSLGDCWLVFWHCVSCCGQQCTIHCVTLCESMCAHREADQMVCSCSHALLHMANAMPCGCYTCIAVPLSQNLCCRHATKPWLISKTKLRSTLTAPSSDETPFAVACGCLFRINAPMVNRTGQNLIQAGQEWPHWLSGNMYVLSRKKRSGSTKCGHCMYWKKHKLLNHALVAHGFAHVAAPAPMYGLAEAGSFTQACQSIEVTPAVCSS